MGREAEYHFSALATAAAGAVAVFWSLDYTYYAGNTPGSGFFPFWLGIALLATAVGIFTKGAVARRATASEESAAQEEGHDGSFLVELRRAGAVVIVTAAFLIIWIPVGSILAMSFLQAALLWIFGFGRSWLVRIGTAVAISICTYLLFAVALNIDLPPAWPRGLG